MPLLTSLAYPDLIRVVMDLLDGTDGAASRPGVPTNFNAGTDKLIVIKNAGGAEDGEGLTFNGIVQVQCYAPTYDQASDLASDCEITILTCPATEIGPDKILIDTADLWTGPQEQPDQYPDDRRITTHYRLGVRRQFRP